MRIWNRDTRNSQLIWMNSCKRQHEKSWHNCSPVSQGKILKIALQNLTFTGLDRRVCFLYKTGTSNITDSCLLTKAAKIRLPGIQIERLLNYQPVECYFLVFFHFNKSNINFRKLFRKSAKSTASEKKALEWSMSSNVNGYKSASQMSLSELTIRVTNLNYIHMKLVLREIF